MILFDEFIEDFKQNLKKFSEIEKNASELIQAELKSAGIIAITSSRIKSEDRLKEKIEKRNIEKKYQTIEEIKKDIVDLVGLRVALYFPNDIDKVDNLIRKHFRVAEIKKFPEEQRKSEDYSRRFAGYCATHYRVYFNKEHSMNLQDQVFEIQVASLLMHAWSEVEHDLVYKMKTGQVSLDEYEALDEINGLMIAGELSLQRLQRISNQRITLESKEIENHYQLADIIYEKGQKLKISDLNIGDVNAAFLFMQKKGRLTISKINNDLEKVDFQSTVPISEQLFDMHAEYYTDNMLMYNNTRKRVSLWNTGEIDEKILGAFLKKWIKVEKLIRDLSSELLRGSAMGRLTYSEKELRSNSRLSNDVIIMFTSLRRSRNNIIHGTAKISNEELNFLNSEVDQLIIELEKLSGSTRDIL